MVLFFAQAGSRGRLGDGVDGDVGLGGTTSVGASSIFGFDGAGSVGGEGYNSYGNGGDGSSTSVGSAGMNGRLELSYELPTSSAFLLF